MSDTQPSGPGFPAWVIPVTALFGLAGVAFLGFTVYTMVTGGPSRATPTPPATVEVALTFPTRTPVPTAAPPTAAPTDTAVPTATAAPAELLLNITQPANVRSGPGTNYPPIGGLQAGSTAALVGRDSSAQWFVIQYGSGQGWVSGTVSSFSGDVNALPVVAAPPPPPPTRVPPTAVPPTNAPAPTAAPTATTGGYMSRGIQGNAFWVENTTAGVGQDIWFNFKVTNTTDSPIAFGVLAAHSDQGPNAQSWTNAELGAHQVLEWRDHINIAAAGTYQLYLGICYSGKDACLANTAPWDRLSASVAVTVQ